MNASPHSSCTRIDLQALEARLARRVVTDLGAQTEHLPADVQERLRFAREQALTHAREARGASAALEVGITRSGAVVLGSLRPWVQRAASVLPLLLLLGGLFVIQQWSSRERVLAAAEIDTLLLGDSLPPSAYGDPGFAEFLRSPPQP